MRARVRACRWALMRSLLCARAQVMIGLLVRACGARKERKTWHGVMATIGMLLLVAGMGRPSSRSGAARQQ